MTLINYIGFPNYINEILIKLKHLAVTDRRGALFGQAWAAVYGSRSFACL